MNIFKILSSGDQKLKEPAVTSFLAYLLDPYDTHGLKTIFLEYFLKPVIENPNNFEVYKEFCIKDKKTGKQRIKSNLIYDYEFDINSEVSTFFKEDSILNDGKKRNDIDIVIEITSKNNAESNKHYFLIENKIQDGAINGAIDKKDQDRAINGAKDKKDDQLTSQVKSFLDEFDLIDNSAAKSVCTIFLTHDSKRAESYYRAFITAREKAEELNKPKKILPKEKGKTLDDVKFTSHHHYWNKENTGIYSILNDILSKESIGFIEPVQDYTKHTIKAFMNFIDSGFKSKKDEKDESYKKKYYETIDEIFAIWGINEENKALTNKIITELKNEGISLAFTNRHISIKKPMNICGIIKPAKTIKSSIPCFIKNSSAISYDNDYKLGKDGWYHLTVNEKNIDKFIQNASNLINAANK
jgi:hypothetical protein